MKILQNILGLLRLYGHWLFVFGLLLVFFSLIAETSPYKTTLIVISIILFLIDFLLAFGLLRVRHDDLIPKRVRVNILIVYGLAFFSIFTLYFRSQLTVPVDKITGEGDSLIERIRLFLLFILLISAIGASIYRITLALSQKYRRLASERILVYRQSFLARAGIMTGIFVIVLVTANYFTFLRNPSWDLTPGYLSFSVSSEKILQSVDDELYIYAFLPERQVIPKKSSSVARPELFDIAGDIQLLLERIPLLNSKIKLKIVNADFTGTDTSEFENVSNGVIILRSYRKDIEETKEKPYVERRIYVFNKNDKKRLEQELIKGILFVASPVKNIYFTALNGEKETLKSQQNAPSGIKEFKRKLALYNAITHSLDRKSSWPLRIPDNADAVFVIGPTQRLSFEAQRSLIRYLQYGGKVFITIDPEGKEDFSWLLGFFDGGQYRFNKNIVVNSQLRGLLVTNEFLAHPITKNLYKDDDFLLYAKSGFFESNTQPLGNRQINRLAQIMSENNKEEKDKSTIIIKERTAFVAQEVVYSPYDTFIDKNNNNLRDANEKEAKRTLLLTYELGNQEKKSAKLLIASSTAWLNDWSLRYPINHKNLTLGIDVYFWLIENPLLAAIKGPELSEQTVSLDDKTKWKILVFGVFLFPLFLALLLAGIIGIYRRKSKYQTTHVLEK